jgi:hypothetical protein
MNFKDYLKEEQKTWKLKDWLWWYWYGFELRFTIWIYPLTKLYCKTFGHSKRFTDECERCGVDL